MGGKFDAPPVDKHFVHCCHLTPVVVGAGDQLSRVVVINLAYCDFAYTLEITQLLQPRHRLYEVARRSSSGIRSADAHPLPKLRQNAIAQYRRCIEVYVEGRLVRGRAVGVSGRGFVSRRSP